MTISEKLTQIAVNEQKIYEAGYRKGKSEGGKPKVIHIEEDRFVILYEEGMTWEEWYNTDYNKPFSYSTNFYTVDGKVTWGGFSYVADEFENPINPTDEMSDTINYRLVSLDW